MGSKYAEMHDSIIKSILDIIVLNVLKDKPICGNKIGMELKRKFNVYVSPSMLYTLLNRLQSMNLVGFHSNEANKKNFVLTDEGQRIRKNQMRAYVNFTELVEGWLKA